MPRGQPFTAMCAALSRPPFAGMADLHAHTTASDGTWSPGQLLAEARKAGLAYLAITDHDTLAGSLEARRLATAGDPAILIGVEITACHRGRDTHLLAYGVDPGHPGLGALLGEMRARRRRRHGARLEALMRRGIRVPELSDAVVPGRRHLAQALADLNLANGLQDAFRRFRAEFMAEARDAAGIEIAAAIDAVMASGGKAVLAHPPQGTNLDGLKSLKEMGLAGLEVYYPDFSKSWTSTLKAWARALGLGLTGGSDCHGPGPRGPGCRHIEPSQAAWLWPDIPKTDSTPGGKPCLALSGAN